MELNDYWIKAFDRMDQAINGRIIDFVLLFECAEYSVPNDEHSAIVLVDVFGISTVMHSMMAWSVENVFQRTNRIYDLSMEPGHEEFA